MAVLVLRENTSRKGDLKSLDVIAVANSKADALKDVAAGEYVLQADSAVERVTVSYRTVQDVSTVA